MSEESSQFGVSDEFTENTRWASEQRKSAYDSLSDIEAYRTAAREAKRDAIECLPELIEQLRTSVRENGGEVFLAESASDAREYISDIVVDEGEDIVKSKSATVKELELVDCLDSQGHSVTETDIGDFILQIDDDSAHHTLGTTIHRSKDDNIEAVDASLRGVDSDDGIRTVTKNVAEAIDDRIANADVGITGANFLLAETGSVVVVTNEGNAQRVIQGTDTHVVVAGIEKILPSASELTPFLKLLGRAGLGKSLPQYVSLLRPPIRSPIMEAGKADTPIDALTDEREFHLVLVDNGRRELRDDEHLREALYCVRCGACENSCSNFQLVGGTAFGGETYSGGIGSAWEYATNDTSEGEATAAYCSGCSTCTTACPVEIDIPWLNTVLRSRSRENSEIVPPFDEQPAEGTLSSTLVKHFRKLLKSGSWLPSVTNRLRQSETIRTVAERATGVDRRYPVPAFDGVPLRESESAIPANDDPDIILYTDLLTEYWFTEIGRSALRVLTELGCRVAVTPPMDSGRLALSQGMVSVAETRARETHRRLASALEDDTPVLTLQPSVEYVLTNRYRKLLDSEKYSRLADGTIDIFEWIDREASDAELRRLRSRNDHDTYRYHAHCQERPRGEESRVYEVLERAGYDLKILRNECCGAGGPFGATVRNYECSRDVTRNTMPKLDDEVLVSPEMLCNHHIRAVRDDIVVHPLSLLRHDDADE